MNEQPSAPPVISSERCKFLLSLTDVQKIQILIGRSVPEAGAITGIERQFVRAHVTAEENQLL